MTMLIFLPYQLYIQLKIVLFPAFDIAAKQPEHLRDFYDKYFEYNGFITLKDFYDQFYNPESFAKEAPDNNDYSLDT